MSAAPLDLPAAPAPAPAFVPYEERMRANVIKLWRRSFSNSVAAYERDIDAACRNHPEWFIVALAGGAVVGTCIGTSDQHRHWLYYLCVARHARRRRVATGLVRHLEGLMRAAGARQLGLHVVKHNRQALAFYRSLGYETEQISCLGKRL
ncbi:MAG: GNAT family N-acetyltransferase [Betaproteobacteria bacterium AqS2]|uniref:GNAT family N-acetyltransferase n=1 Tax=Candidatus Amphirhobacter heronislandensis TaxID=1732024 RepID=A0A930UE31_9GAMM|nr:GNAT family N-acetyltransferase [Betaproteobacteria bacterium AqS2]